MSTWMIYGANGYTGELIARRAAETGETPILAGRRGDAISTLGDELGLETRTFSLDDPRTVQDNLDGITAVLHCAGPFVDTSKPMVKACLETTTHYLDITGEIAVFEACQRRSEAAKEAGCAVIPGVGFDVVPTDCLAAQLAEKLPDADKLELAFAAGSGPSKGTAKTVVRGLGEGGAVRVDGKIEKVPLAFKTQTIPFADKERTATTIPWGDVSTAFYSTGIGNIEVYMAMPPKLIKRMRWLRPLKGLLGSRPVQSFLTKRVNSRVTGPTEEQREQARSEVWGRVSNGDQVVEGTLSTVESYKLTMLTALEAALRASRNDVAPGTWTPSQAFGSQFIDQFEDTAVVINGNG